MKVWGIIFCCIASWALHIDLVRSMSTDSFLIAYQRFTAITLTLTPTPWFGRTLGPTLLVQCPCWGTRMPSWKAKTEPRWRSMWRETAQIGHGKCSPPIHRTGMELLKLR